MATALGCRLLRFGSALDLLAGGRSSRWWLAARVAIVEVLRCGATFNRTSLLIMLPWALLAPRFEEARQGPSWNRAAQGGRWAGRLAL